MSAERHENEERLALLSVYDKEGLVPLAKVLVEQFGYRLLSTGGTARTLRESGFVVTDVSDYTGFPEMMEGRVKTLHPKIHGGVLCRRDVEGDLREAQRAGIGLIDLIVVNLYPFEDTVARPGVAETEAIEQIDIGGVALLRCAAKNHSHVTVVCEPADYGRVLEALKGSTDITRLRRQLAIKVFRRTTAYDAAIATYFQNEERGTVLVEGVDHADSLNLDLEREMALRYGENPQQKAALYGGFFERFEQLQGKELGYNNILDISAAADLMGEFDRPTVAIIKHGNPCGTASAADLVDAWEDACATDQKAPFGGVVVVNRTIDRDLALDISQIWLEIIIAPQFTDGAREIFGKKRNLRLLISKGRGAFEGEQEVRSIAGGVLRQDRDLSNDDPSAFRVVSEREPSDKEWNSLLFGWRVVKHVKSNAVVLVKGERTAGIGAGQMSRVDSSEIAVWKAGQAGISLEGSVAASDGLIPFPDALLVAAEAGATAMIQPGGAQRDKAIIEAANAHDMAMIFSGIRHFRH